VGGNYNYNFFNNLTDRPSFQMPEMSFGRSREIAEKYRK
jgi:hypothetical protein